MSTKGDVNASATKLATFFHVDANAIGDGYVRVEEDPSNGNLYLKNHVFTQVYSKTGIRDPYEFAMTVYEMQGGHQAGVFFRAPACECAPTTRGMAEIRTTRPPPDAPASGCSCTGIASRSTSRRLTIPSPQRSRTYITPSPCRRVRITARASSSALSTTEPMRRSWQTEPLSAR